ncbi:HD domain-containing protein [Prochlorococcus sp. MIT 1341]|uniref:HD domain-containing protein n=1 Tax=Prochlorococcus sp. MIT 1341 TaxID=3096221 RepID=UPI002A74CDC0|nr:HD domain-containing protein [Prochlorococcus sp. MIT 1341]
MSLRTYHDPLHRGINLDSNKPEEAMVMALIDTEPFQRLRRIRQLGPAYLTFHGAESSRFTHSLGVFQLARRALQKLEKHAPSLSQYRGVLFGSALLHDIGHAPLSHTGEEIFDIDHEQWSARIVREHPSVYSALESFSSGTAESVACLLSKGIAPQKVIKSLVSSQLDCDRLDYLMRDSHSTGARYGQLDLDRIINALTIAPDGDIAINPKGLMAVEHYLVVRDLMYRTVYNHRKNEVCNWILEQVVRTARQMGAKKVWADTAMSKWLWNPAGVDLKNFLANDDLRAGYHLLRWQDEAPNYLSELCRRFLQRDLLKALPVDHLENSQQLEILSISRQLTQKQGQDPDFCCGLRRQNWHGYLPYKGGLRIWDGKNLSALEKNSALIESLITPTSSAWLIHPKEVNKALENELKSFESQR